MRSPTLMALVLFSLCSCSCGDELSPTEQLLVAEAPRLKAGLPAYVKISQIDTCTAGAHTLALVKITTEWTPEGAVDLLPIHMIMLTDVVEDGEGYYSFFHNIDGPQWDVEIECPVPVRTTVSAFAMAAVSWRSPRFEKKLQAQWEEEEKPFPSADLLYQRLAE